MNSAQQVAEYLERIGNECKIVQVVDSNCIDREMYSYKPDLVIIEALWVSGDKMKELLAIPRYKNVKWVIRIHSDIGFLSSETLATKYINDYIGLNNPNVCVALNNKDFCEQFSKVMGYKFAYLPNIITTKKNKPYKRSKGVINIGCFGSLRILKNQVFQAVCAIRMADNLHKTLFFHITADINIDNPTQNPVLNNLQEIFSRTKHKLIVYSWFDHEGFERLIRTMDLGLQLSFTESFNIVTADFINNGVPIVVSNAVKWMPKYFRTSTTNYKDVIQKLHSVYELRNCSILQWMAKRKLNQYNKISKREWYKFLLTLKK